MLTNFNTIILGLLIFLSIFLVILLNYVLNRKNRKQLDRVFGIILGLILSWLLSCMLQIICVNLFGANPIYFDYCAYISVCFLPVAFLFLALTFSKTKINFKRRYFLLFIIPALSVVLLWTNNLHHLFYKEYSTDFSATVYGPYFYIHTYYTLALYAISLFIFIRYSIKNSGFFSKQVILILIGTLVPVISNTLSNTGIISTSVYITPISFAVTIICFIIGTSRFNLLKLTPIALQRIVDRISDSYLILNEDDVVTDFNATFLTTFKLKNTNIRNKNIFDLISHGKEKLIDEKKLKNALNEVKNSSKTFYIDKHFHSLNKYFHIEINTITANGNFLGTLILLKDTTQHMLDMQTIKDNQDMLMEKERLASLGQLIGGIAHNLKTPIMSISGAAEGLNDLIKEYDSSIGDPDVTDKDHHDIAKDMYSWVCKIKEYSEYMSDVITAVKGQAVVMSEQDTFNFTVEELVKRVDILMRHELKNSLINLKTSINTDKNIEIQGNVNSLVQVINNMISNSIQAYNGKTNKDIEFTISKDNSNIVFSIKDYAGGLPKEVENKIFKEMVTTKGKNGTGLGLFMSYSNIRAHFNGNILVDTKPGIGTEFKIYLPI